MRGREESSVVIEEDVKCVEHYVVHFFEGIFNSAKCFSSRHDVSWSVNVSADPAFGDAFDEEPVSKPKFMFRRMMFTK